MTNHKPIYEIHEILNINDKNRVNWVITNDTYFKVYLEELNYNFRTTYINSINLYDIYFDNSSITVDEFNELLLKYLAKRS